MNDLTKHFFSNCREGFSIKRIFIPIHFGFVLSWFVRDQVSFLLFGQEYASLDNLYIKFGILLLFTPLFSFCFYFLIDFLNIFYSKHLQPLQNHPKIKRFLGSLRVLKGGERKFHHTWLQIFLVICLSLFAGFYIFGENLKAQWWIIDDHEIMRYLGPDNQLELKDIPRALLSETEIGHYGGKPRYRPSYYLIRLLETALWGNHPTLFYLTRLLIFSFFIFTSWYVLKHALGSIGSFIFAMAIISFNYWADIFSRLGPSEAYAVFGFSLFLIGFYQYQNQDKNRSLLLAWVLIFLGAIILIGSKENMVLIAIPVVFMLIKNIKEKNLTLTQLLFSIAILSFCLFVILAVYQGIHSRGSVDMYLTDVSTSSLLVILRNELRTLPFSIIKYFSYDTLIMAVSYAFIAAGLWFIPLLHKKEFPESQRRVNKILLRSVLYLGSVYLFFLSQRVFYADRWPTGIRYDFPGKLGEMVALIILINTCLLLFERCKMRKFDLAVFKFGYGILFLIIIVQNNFYYDLIASAENNVQRTSIFTQHINQIKQETEAHPENIIVLQSFDAMDNEPILSVKYFLEAYGVTNEVAIQVNQYTSSMYPEHSSERALALKLEQISAQGGWDGFVPLGDINDLQGACYSIDFSGTSNTRCTDLGRIW